MRVETCSCPLVRHFRTLCWVDISIFWDKDKIGKDFSKKSKNSVSAKAVALIGMSSTRLEPACAVIQNVVSIIAEQGSLRSRYFLHTRCGAGCCKRQ